jgi:hypothetical protein
MMKCFAIILLPLAVSFCVMGGCSTSPSGPKYSDIPPDCTNAVIKTSRELEIEQMNRHFDEIYEKADVVLDTDNWSMYEERKPRHGSAEIEVLGSFLRDEKFPHYGVAVVTFNSRMTLIGHYRPGEIFPYDDPYKERLAEVRKALKGAGFVDIYLFANHFFWYEPIP